MRVRYLFRVLLSVLGMVLVGADVHAALFGTGTGPSELRLQWEYSTSPFMPLSIVADELGRPYVYVAQKGGGLLVLDVTDLQRPPLKVGGITKQQLGQLDAMYVTQQGSYLYLALGDFFAAGGSPAGLAIVKVSNPLHPTVSALWRSKEKLGGTATVLIDGDFAYLGAMEEGVFLFDITDKNKLRFVSSIQPDIHFPVVNPSTMQHPNARGLAIYNNLLFVAYDAGGLRVVDISDKNNPGEIAKYINTAMAGKQQAYNNIVINWPYAYIAVDYCGMEVLDIQDVNNIRQVGWWNPWDCQSGSNNWFNSPGHTNQLVLDAERNLVFISAGDSELRVLDVSEPSRPQLAAMFGRPKNDEGTWGVTATEEMVYLAYIKIFIPFKTNWSGIKGLLRGN